MVPNLIFARTASNGLNLTRSVKMNHSRLKKVLRFLRDNPESTKRQILESLYPTKEFFSENSILTLVTGRMTYALRSYQSAMFMVAVADGFLAHRRQGKTVVWNRGPNAHFVDL